MTLVSLQQSFLTDMQSRIRCGLMIGMVLLSLSACDKIDDPEARMAAFIATKVEERLESARATLLGRCREAVLTEAGQMADSILFERARLRRDTATRPPRPFRPGMPDIKTLQDSVPVAPLFDSLGRRRPQIQ